MPFEIGQYSYIPDILNQIIWKNLYIQYFWQFQFK